MWMKEASRWMAEEYGRWPWPRYVFGEFLAGLADYEVGAVLH